MASPIAHAIWDPEPRFNQDYPWRIESEYTHDGELIERVLSLYVPTAASKARAVQNPTTRGTRLPFQSTSVTTSATSSTTLSSSSNYIPTGNQNHAPAMTLPTNLLDFLADLQDLQDQISGHFEALEELVSRLPYVDDVAAGRYRDMLDEVRERLIGGGSGGRGCETR